MCNYIRKLTILFLVTILTLAPIATTAFAYSQPDDQRSYVVYTTEGEFLFERTGIQVGDQYLSKDFKKYEVISANPHTGIGVAKFIQHIKKPDIDMNITSQQIAATSKNIGLYLTHNAESYVIGDGTDSIYGAGGIHDVAKRLQQEYQKLGITTVLNQTLHLPHNSAAYTKSALTARQLLNDYSNLDALFDVHRDGSSRASYIARVGGADRCMIRLVVGKANPNYKVNERFAIYIMTVANELYPWLIKDIYYATGHYNQALFSKSLLLEMGCHLVEKPLVLASVAPFADVVNTTLFHTTVDSGGNLTINGPATPSEPLVTNAIDQQSGWQLTDFLNIFIIIGSAIFILSFICMLNNAFGGKDKKKK